MFFQENTFDDLLNEAFRRLHEDGVPGSASRGKYVELTGVLFKLHNPLSRLSRSEAKGRPFSCIGELFWYLAGRDDVAFIRYYLPEYAENAEEDGTLRGAYGPRLFPAGQPSQIEQILHALTIQNSTRRAVMQLFSASDIEIGQRYREIPCTTTIQFLIRDERLECIVSMRSNDAFKGFPHDVFCFTMIQEMVARALDVDCGTYHHFVGSFHLYEGDVQKSQSYLDEGFQSELAMPAMPAGNAFSYVESFVQKMTAIRLGGGLDAIGTDLPEYWNDLLRLLVAYHHSLELPVIDEVQAALHDPTYFPFVERRKIVPRPGQTE
jgi:thymidylate synthase